jgi:hypothetical protein
MNSKVNIRSYNKGDEYAHVDLMWNSSKHIRNIQYWKWVNSDLWGHAPIIKYATFEKIIIGSYVIHPIELFFNNKIIKSGFATQVLVHSQYRNLSIIRNLNTSIVDSCAEKSIDFIFGFPNDSIWNVNLRLFEWHNAGRIKYLKLDINQSYKLKSEKNAFFLQESELCMLDKFISEIDNARNKDIVNYRVTIDWFKWRFFHNPLQYYKVICVEHNNDIHGVLVLKNYHKNGGLVGHIVYIEITCVNYDTVVSLMRKAFDYFESIGISEVTLWKTDNDWIMKCLKKIGFIFTNYYTNFGIRNIGMKDIDCIPDVGKWNISMSNSDAF